MCDSRVGRVTRGAFCGAGLLSRSDQYAISGTLFLGFSKKDFSEFYIKFDDFVHIFSNLSINPVMHIGPART